MYCGPIREQHIRNPYVHFFLIGSDVLSEHCVQFSVKRLCLAIALWVVRRGRHFVNFQPNTSFMKALSRLQHWSVKMRSGCRNVFTKLLKQNPTDCFLFHHGVRFDPIREMISNDEYVAIAGVRYRIWDSDFHEYYFEKRRAFDLLHGCYWYYSEWGYNFWHSRHILQYCFTSSSKLGQY